MINKILVLLLFISNIITGVVFKNNGINTLITGLLSIIIFISLFFRNNKSIVPEIEERKIEEKDIPEKKVLREETPFENKEESNNKDYSDIIQNYLEHFYYIKECLPVITKLSKNTRKFEEETLQSLFNEFENIWSESETIVKESKESMKSIFDSKVKNNLGYVLNASKEINNDFSNFIPVLKTMSNLTDNFISTSIESFNTITKTTKDIVELAEQVKVISINVRIEAARVKDSGGFQVLGNDISTFAEKTSKVALLTNEQIVDTKKKIELLREELSVQLHNVSGMANIIYKKVSPFEAILGSSSDSIMDVIQNLNSVSGQLQSNLRNSISRLQYQDITNQETDHVLGIIEHIKDIKVNEIVALSKEDKKNIRTNIIDHLKKISTTDSEHEAIDNFCKLWDIEIVKDNRESGTLTDDGVFLF